MAEILSKFQFVDHKITKMLVELPIGYKGERSESINYFATYATEYHEDFWNGSVTIGFRQQSKDAENPSTLYEIIISGRFTYSGENNGETEKEFVKFLKSSGAATLIPLARAAITSAGAISGYPGVCTIPNINVYQMNWIEPEKV